MMFCSGGKYMSRGFKIPLKIAVFLILFYLLCLGVAAVLRNDYDSFARIQFHELYTSEKNIDVLFCGASHVYRNISCAVADKVFGDGRHSFICATSAQRIEATYAVIRQVAKYNDLKEIFLDIDIDLTMTPSVCEKTGFTSDYLVARNLKDPRIKLDFLCEMSHPKYYINSFLPIGKDKEMTLNPVSLARNARCFLSGDFFKYVVRKKHSQYEGRGSVLVFDSIKKGTFSSTFQDVPVCVKNISEDWKNTIDKIILFCRQRNIRLIFYSAPSSDFCLQRKTNYNEYYIFMKTFCASRGFAYYDFNLANEKYFKLEDDEFYDDNHLNKNGNYKFTQFLCSYFTGKIPAEDAFYNSYAEKIAAQEDRIYGLVIWQSDDKKTVRITPVVNHVKPERITYSAKVIGNTETVITEKTSETVIQLPAGMSGKLIVSAYLDGVRTNTATVDFFTF